MCYDSVISLAKLGACQLPDTDIRVNAICPGLIEVSDLVYGSWTGTPVLFISNLYKTGMTVNTFDYARAKGITGKIGQLNPQRRFGIPEGTHIVDVSRSERLTLTRSVHGM